MEISQISISGFKAIRNMEFEPGNINVLIGANGAGKSTVLEAIGLLSLAMTDRVDEVGLARKGVRLSTPALYKSSFKDQRKKPTIDLSMRWKDGSNYCYDVHLNTPLNEGEHWRFHSEALYKDGEHIWGRSGRSKDSYDSRVGMLMLDPDEHLEDIRPTIDNFRNYAIYQPTTPILRGNLSDSSQEAPLGLNGGRLAEAIADLIHEKDDDVYFGSMLMDELLELIDWADSFLITSPKKSNINAAVPTTRRVIEFCDKYMRESDHFTAYDASEGSLYVLFLLCLAMHSKAPTIFAVDNFDQAMNPRLAKVVTRKFCQIIERQKKTVFLTTHNPLVLDGMDLRNNAIRLFTVERNRKTGEAELQRIFVTQELLDKDMPLSRLWINGLLGGVPNLL